MGLYVMYILRKYITHTHIFNTRLRTVKMKKNQKMDMSKRSLCGLKSVIPNKLLNSDT